MCVKIKDALGKYKTVRKKRQEIIDALDQREKNMETRMEIKNGEKTERNERKIWRS